MIGINYNAAQAVASRQMNRSQKDVAATLARLSTGLRLQSGSDDPSGLIASESFKSRENALGQGISNAERASNMVGTAEGALAQVGSQLSDLEGLISQMANSGATTAEERDAIQLQVDSTLGNIQSIASNTSFNGKKLLDGSLGYKTTGVVAASVANLSVNAAKVPSGSTKAMNIAVQTAATRARVDYTGGTLAAGNNVSLEVTGNNGTTQLSFAAGTTIAQMATVINASTNDTGIQATVAGTTLQFESADYGSQQAVAVRNVGGTFATTAANANGTDAVVRVNGALAGANGTNVTYRDKDTDFSFALTATSNVAAATSTFNVTGGGADFQLGATVNDSNRASIGLQSVAATSLGNSTVGFLSTLRSGEANALTVTGNLGSAQKIATAAIKQVAMLRGRLGAFQKNTIDANIGSMQAELDATSKAGSAIRDADFATETAALTRQQVLQQASQSAFAIANQTPQNALALLSLVR